VAYHCVWPNEVEISQEDGYRAYIANEYRRFPKLVCDEVTIATAVATELRLLDLLIERAREKYSPTRIRLVCAISSHTVRELFDNQADLEMTSLLDLPEHSSKYNPNTFGLYLQRLPSLRRSRNFLPEYVRQAAFPGMHLPGLQI
jgi:hypothetical protein